MLVVACRGCSTDAFFNSDVNQGDQTSILESWAGRTRHIRQPYSSLDMLEEKELADFGPVRFLRTRAKETSLHPIPIRKSNSSFR